MNVLMVRRPLLLLLLAPLLALSLPAAVHAAPGDLIGSFGEDGVVHKQLGTSSGQVAYDSVRLADGHVVMVGRTASAGAALVARYNPDGTVDETFGDAGVTEIEGVILDSVTVDDAGRIVAAGHDGDLGIVVRLLSDGTVDPGFAADGIFRARFDLSEPDPGGTRPESPRLPGIEALDDGTILAVGRGVGCPYDGESDCEYTLVVRLDSSGAPAPIAGQTDGTHVDQTDEITAIDVLPDGRVVTVLRRTYNDSYESWSTSTVEVTSAPAADGSRSVLWSKQLDSDGYVPSEGGRVTPTASDGFYLVSGAAIVKARSDGLDTEFGRKGVIGISQGLFRGASAGHGVRADDLVVDENGKLVLAGITAGRGNESGAFLARLDSNGKPDPTFNNDGFLWFYNWLGTDSRGLVRPRVHLSADGYLLTGTLGDYRRIRFALAAVRAGTSPAASCDGKPATWIGSSKRDYVSVTSGVIVTGAGRDEIEVRGRSSQTVICAGAGNDTVRMYGGKAFGGPGDDKIEGNSRKERRTRKVLPSAEVIYGGPGADTLNGFGGDDRIFGDGGPDTIRGGDGDDDLYGGAGSDDIGGEAGNDHLFGGPGVDDLVGGPTIRPRSYYSGSLGKTRARFTRIGNRFVQARIYSFSTCREGWSGWSWDSVGSPRYPIKIGKGGKIRHGDPTSDWADVVEARLKGKTIKGRYMSVIEDDWTNCWSGKSRSNPWVQFKASFKNRRIQLVRQ